MMNALEKAIKCLGSQKKLAQALGVSDQAITNWKAGEVPTDRCYEIEIATGGQVRCHELRPGKFPVPEKAA